MSFPRKSRLACLTLFAATLARSIGAEEPTVPIGLQTELIAKVAGYDRHYLARAGAKAHVLIVSKAGDPDSVKAANQAKAALGALQEIAGLPHEEASITYSGAKALVDEIAKQSAAIVYISSGLSNELAGIADALTGKDVLTVAAIAGDVPKGVVLGFDLVSGKPKLLVHLTQARKQNAAFRAEALKLMKVYE